MLRVERYSDLEEALRAAMDGMQSRLWTALPAIVQSFDSVRMTCEVKPSIMIGIVDDDGVETPTLLPLLVDCPVIFPQGGGFILTFPVTIGDECLVIFSSRCIDSWWQSGGYQTQAEFRMHNLSDGFVLPGVRSQVRKVPDVSVSNVQLRLDDGTAFIDITPEGSVGIVAPGDLNIVGNTNILGEVFINGSVMITGSIGITGAVSITGSLTVNGIDVGPLHRHTGVDTGSGTSGGVAP